MYRGLSHKGTTCYRHSNFFMVTKRQGRHPEGLEKERKKEEAGMLSYAHTLHPEREVPDGEREVC